jgi:methionyl-tRNA formyltransferase
MNQPLRLAYAGTPEFAVPALQSLAQAGHELAAVFTQPDRPAGRGRRLTPPPVKCGAEALGLPVHQPEALDRATLVDAVGGHGIDALVVVAFGQILAQDVLALPRLAALNVHASLLPRWRGSAPIVRALLAGDEVTGVTVMGMAPGLDTGPILLRRRCEIESGDTTPALHDRLATLGADAVTELCSDLPRYLANAEPQDEAAATYAAKLSRGEGRIDWHRPATEIERRVRALQPWPGAWTTLQGATWRIWSAVTACDPAHGSVRPGSVVACGLNGIDVATGAGLLRLLRLQPPGRRAMSAADVSNARDLSGCHLDS